jgi:hypothetical protein
MDRALADAGGVPVFLNATGFGRPLYERLGFVPLSTTSTHYGRLSAANASGRTSPAHADDLPAIAALDAEVTGCDRGRLLARLPEFASGVRVATSGGVLTGYAGVWDNQGTAMVGPVVAADETQALDLINDVVAAVDGPVRLDVQADALRRWAGDRGAGLRFSTTVMVHGARTLPGDRSRWFVPFMQALG